ncbi:MAG TPA: DUF721 domain-containing protein [bacterium]
MEDGSRPSEMRSLLRRLFREQSRQPLLALNLLRRHWPDVVGPELSARTEPRRLARGVLWVTTPDACWAYELQFFKAELLASVQAFLDSMEVREVRFQAGGEARESVDAAGDAAAPGAPPREAPPGPLSPTAVGAEGEPEAPEALARAAQSIGDPALRAVFQRSLAKQHRGRNRREP